MNSQTDPNNQEQFFDAMNKAVSEGNQEEIDKLMAADSQTDSTTSPDATQDEKVDDKPADTAGDTDTSSTEVDDKDEVVTSPPEAAADKAAAIVPAQPTELELLRQQIHSLKSEVGRVNHVQSRLNQLEKENAKLSKQVNKPAEPVVVDRKIEERLNKLKEIDPDLATMLADMYDEQKDIKGKITPQAQAAPSDTQDDDDAVLYSELARVQTVHPEATEIFAHPAWQQWKNSLAPEQRAWAESDKAEQVVVAVSEFKKAFAAAQSAPPTPPPATAPVDTSIKDARDRKLQESTGKGRSTAIKDQGTADIDKMFSETYAQIQKQDHIGT